MYYLPVYITTTIYRVLLLELVLLLSLPVIGQIASIEDHFYDAEDNYTIGTLSAKWESGNKGPGTISNSIADPGGLSYGTYQISTKHGYIKDFLQNEGALFCDYFDENTPGTEAFNKQWKSIAKEKNKDFHKSQHQYIKRTHYDPFIERLEKNLALYVDEFSPVLKDVLWSISVQHGPYTKVVKNALSGEFAHTLTETELIKLIYKERSRREGGNLAYFPRVLDSWQQHLIERFELELEDALQRLEDYSEKNALKNNAIASLAENIYINEPPITVIDIGAYQQSRLMTYASLLPSLPQSQLLYSQSPDVNTSLASAVTSAKNTVSDTVLNSSSKSYRIVLLILDNPNHVFSKLPDDSVYTEWDETHKIYKYYTGKNLSQAQAVDCLLYTSPSPRDRG